MINHARPQTGSAEPFQARPVIDPVNESGPASRDDEAPAQVERTLRERLDFEALITDISACVVGANPDSIDRALVDALERHLRTPAFRRLLSVLELSRAPPDVFCVEGARLEGMEWIEEILGSGSH